VGQVNFVLSPSQLAKAKLLESQLVEDIVHVIMACTQAQIYFILDKLEMTWYIEYPLVGPHQVDLSIFSPILSFLP
jgi:hypothetical protein